MRRLTTAVSLPIIALALVSAAALGAGLTLGSVTTAPPSALRSPVAAKDLPVEQRVDDDQREVQLTLATGGPRTVAAPRTGVLTGLACAVGEDVRSGTVVAKIDGRDVIALASSEPLWRDMDTGTTGSDVRALQQELVRLGIHVAVDGEVGPRTIAGVRRLVRTTGSQLRIEDSVPVDLFAWLPAASVPVRACDGTVGTTVESDAPLMTLPVDLVAARVATLPHDAVAGARVVRVGATAIPVDAAGTVRDAADLRALASTAEYASAIQGGDTSSLAAEWVLSKPDTVFVVPPTSLYDVQGDQGCLQVPSARRPVSVHIVGSDLGQSFVRTSGTEIDHVRAAPDTGRPCR